MQSRFTSISGVSLAADRVRGTLEFAFCQLFDIHFLDFRVKTSF